ncbi:MAG: SMP-30/Gluconolaconase/LRE-like region [Nocardioides sp.]|nr:SMP-30/Gluconolaconase/LRE-like region [Nocardioides sp.]
MKRILGRGLGLLAALVLAAPLTVAAAAAPGKWETHVFANVPAPGFPAYVFVHRNGRVYAGTYIDPQGAGVPSRVFEWSAAGQLLRSWAVPGQLLAEDHGVQVANQTRGGKLVLLETSTSSVLTLDVRTGRFHRVARLPGAVPNYAAWGPKGALYVTDYGNGVIWRIPPGGTPRKWFASSALDGVEFGTTGIVFRPGRRDLLISQQTSISGQSLPTNGHLYRLPIRPNGRPGTLTTLWTSQPTELPDGFGVGRSGHIYIAMAGLTAQLVELSASGRELDRFPDTPFTGENGSSIPFDTPCSATFLGSRVLVANQSAIAGDAAHQAILDVEVGEPGRAPYLPTGAHFG